MSSKIYVSGVATAIIAALHYEDVEAHVVNEPPFVVDFASVPPYDTYLDPPSKPHPKYQPQPKRPRK